MEKKQNINMTEITLYLPYKTLSAWYFSMHRAVGMINESTCNLKSKLGEAERNAVFELFQPITVNREELELLGEIVNNKDACERVNKARRELEDKINGKFNLFTGGNIIALSLAIIFGSSWWFFGFEGFNYMGNWSILVGFFISIIITFMIGVLVFCGAAAFNSPTEKDME